MLLKLVLLSLSLSVLTSPTVMGCMSHSAKPAVSPKVRAVGVSPLGETSRQKSGFKTNVERGTVISGKGK